MVLERSDDYVIRIVFLLGVTAVALPLAAESSGPKVIITVAYPADVAVRADDLEETLALDLRRFDVRVIEPNAISEGRRSEARFATNQMFQGTMIRYGAFDWMKREYDAGASLRCLLAFEGTRAKVQYRFTDLVSRSHMFAGTFTADRASAQDSAKAALFGVAKRVAASMD